MFESTSHTEAYLINQGNVCVHHRIKQTQVFRK